jgi:SecD/SecF fusion protein
LYDTIIVFDRVRENIPRMPRAAFSQIVNRSMSEVLTRSLGTTFCTLMPIVALLLFGGVAGSSELQDFAFALMIGVASGAYSSIFIASPVLTQWKEREPQYRARRHRLVEELGYLPAYADTTADIEPTAKKARRPGRLTTPDPDNVSAAEFEQMKRDLELEPETPSRRTSTLTKPRPRKAKPAAPPAQPKPDGAAGREEPDGAPAPQQPDAGETPPAHAPDVAENEGIAPVQKQRGASKSRRSNRRSGRRR